MALDVKAELARELVRPARLFDIELYFSSAVGVPQQDVTVSVHTHALRSHTLVMEFPAQTHAAACDTASRISRLFAQWQPGDGAGSLAERLGVTASDDMLPRVAALPEFLYAKVLRCLRFRHGSVGPCDLLLVAWLTDQNWLCDVPRAPGSGPNATQYEYAAFLSQLPEGSAMRPLAGGHHLPDAHARRARPSKSRRR